MEAEVSAFMGADDEDLWNSAGLFTSDEELRTLAGGGKQKVTSLDFTVAIGVGSGSEPGYHISLDPSPYLGGTQTWQQVLPQKSAGFWDNTRKNTPLRRTRRASRSQGGKGPTTKSWKPNQTKQNKGWF